MPNRNIVCLSYPAMGGPLLSLARDIPSIKLSLLCWVSHPPNRPIFRPLEHSRAAPKPPDHATFQFLILPVGRGATYSKLANSLTSTTCSGAQSTRARNVTVFLFVVGRVSKPSQQAPKPLQYPLRYNSSGGPDNAARKDNATIIRLSISPL